jgi:hypothetical protein
MPTMTVGNSVTLEARPVPDQSQFPGPVTWSHMISPSSASVLFTPNANPTTLQVQTVQGPCTLTMTAQSGMLMASTTFDLVQAPANGISIVVGPIM